MKTQISLKALFITLCFAAIQLQGTLTTLQYWDPSPIYSALNHKPVNSHCLELHTYNEFNDPEKKIPLMTLSVTPVIQRAIRAQDDKGVNFGVITTDADAGAGNRLGDFRGLPFALGLYLGADENGKYLTGTAASNDASTISNTTISDTVLPQAIKNTLVDSSGTLLSFSKILFDSAVTSSTTAALGDPLVGGASGLTPDPNLTTLFSDETLYRITSTYQSTNPEYLSCFSIPTEYLKGGLRFDFNLNFSKYIDLSIQGGLVNVQHKLLSPIESLSEATNNSAIYNGMWVSATVGPPPTMVTQQTSAKDVFKDQITNNMEALLAVDGGIGFEYKDYNVFQAEDFRFCLSLKSPMTKNTSSRDEEDEYVPLVFTPYLQVTGSVPAGNELKFVNALELSAGNNGHFSLGGTVGLTCDFIETVQVGVEGGYDHFFEATHKNRPCPNSKYQSVLYPYKRDLKVQPGGNIHAAINLSAYQFMTNANFFCSFEYINHGKDKHTLVTANSNFFPAQLDDNTNWTSQMFNAAINFEITQDCNFGIVCQIPVSQRNAFNTATAAASLSFLF